MLDDARVAEVIRVVDLSWGYRLLADLVRRQVVRCQGHWADATYLTFDAPDGRARPPSQPRESVAVSRPA